MAHAYFAASLAAVHSGELITVSGGEARHAVGVARLRVGEQLTLLDGEGGSVIAEASEVGATEFTARALADATVEPEPSPGFCSFRPSRRAAVTRWRCRPRSSSALTG